MKRKQLVHYFIANTVGLIALIVSFYEIYMQQFVYAAGFAIIGIIFIVYSFRVSRIKPNPPLPTSDTFTIKEDTATMSNNTTALTLQLVIDQSYTENLTNLYTEMELYGYISTNEEYDFRLEPLLKMKRIDTPIWEFNSRTIPYTALSIVREGNTITRIDVSTGVKSDTLHSLGSVPQNSLNEVIDCYAKIKQIDTHLSGGNYHYISSTNHSFDCKFQPYVLTLRIHV